MNDDPRHEHKGFGRRAEAQALSRRDYRSPVLDGVRGRGGEATVGRVTVRLARELGFCYGVARAIDLAYEARGHFPDRRLFLTGEIIHNADVNRRLAELGIERLDAGASAAEVTSGDVVVLPAFGVTTGELAALRRTGCVVVDTTCGSVMNVWRRVRQYVREGRTSVIHGKAAHEETRATASRAREGGCHSLVLRDRAEAELVGAAVRGGADAPDSGALRERLAHATSPGFDLSRDLERIGLANQTTMLARESLEVAEVLRGAYLDRYGEAELPARFRSFGTICSATQELQDAALELGRAGDLDLVLVVGGHNSSNTGHLLELGLRFGPAFHVEGAAALESADALRHQPLGSRAPAVARDWLPAGEVRVGVCAGASTPDRAIGGVVARLFEVGGASAEAVQAELGEAPS